MHPCIDVPDLMSARAEPLTVLGSSADPGRSEMRWPGLAWPSAIRSFVVLTPTPANDQRRVANPIARAGEILSGHRQIRLHRPVMTNARRKMQVFGRREWLSRRARADRAPAPCGSDDDGLPQLSLIFCARAATTPTCGA